ALSPLRPLLSAVVTSKKLTERLKRVAKRLSHGSRTAARRRAGLFADLAERPSNEMDLIATALLSVQTWISRNA
ncbi:hypothetical protein, partial [Burkholderia vietnamiensis]|uniref:hypothetical protein n=1 Tax=Burkholderia vietnamiensis TaxID=60552 RepID=UPI001E54DF79